jgi:PAS domain S-box-containing protein
MSDTAMPGAAAPASTMRVDVVTSRELGRTSQVARVGFAAVYAVVALTVLPWRDAALWMAAVVVWEAISARILDRAVRRLSQDRATNVFAVLNFLGACVFQALALLVLAKGTALGVAVGATWLAGAFMNNFIYYGANRRLLWSCLAPGVAATVAGPLIAYGPSLNAMVVSGLILAVLAAAGRFSLDHRAVLRQLADRQVALVAIERKLSVAIEASGDGLFEMDLVTRESQVSRTWMAMLGYDPGDAELPVKDWQTFVHADDAKRLQDAFAAHFAGDTPHAACELRMRCKDGAYKWVLTRGRLVARTPEGAPWRIVGTTMDVSARKALEQQLEAARDLAEGANHAKSNFLANMSHEIRTPLNGVIGIAGALAQTKLSAEQGEMVSLVLSSGQVLERLLTDILDQAKIEAGDFTLQVAPFDLRHELDCAAELMRVRASEKGLAFRLTYAEAACGAFEGDAVRLRQILSNLASNAIKFTDRGEVRIDVDVRDRSNGPPVVRIAVADTGIGFSDEVGERLFSRFTQADGSITRRFGGTGLGLAICKSLTELMGGEIGATSMPGQGSVFTVTIPLPRAEERVGAPAGSAAPDPETDRETDGGLAWSSLRILLAEDHPTNQRVVQLILAPLGVDLTIVGDGGEAVELFRPGLFDLILMDMQMPLVDGLSATRQIRALEREAGAPPTPIAMLTANAMDEHRRVAAEAGADGHIAKPITPETLVAGVEALLGAAAWPQRQAGRA